MRLSRRCPCLHEVWRGNLILTILSCENPSNIRELNYGPPMCGANKLTGKMDLVLLRNKWILLFCHGTFQRHVFLLSTRFVRTSRNGSSHKTWSHVLFAQHLEAYLLFALRWICLQYDHFFPRLEAEESISEIDSHHIFSERLSCDRVSLKTGSWQFGLTAGMLVSTWLA